LTAIDLARTYIQKVNGQDGAGAAELFSEEGVIIDPTGREHRGWWEIAAFVTSAAPGTVAHVSDRQMQAKRAIIHGTVMTVNLPPAEIEWDFETDDARITRLTIRNRYGEPGDEMISTTSSDRQ
jgi:SnoaL-like domain